LLIFIILYSNSRIEYDKNGERIDYDKMLKFVCKMLKEFKREKFKIIGSGM
jgi:predicted secreted protein